MSTILEEPGAQDGKAASHQVYEPHRIGLPPIRRYVADVWQRRHFAVELSRGTLRAQHFSTALGQLWLILNPVLLACVYFLLVTIVRDDNRGLEFFAHLMLGVFAYRLVSGSVRQGARSVVGGGRLILNTAFPRTLLPLASVMTAFMRFLPTLAVYAVVHLVAGLPIGLTMLWAVPIFGLLLVLSFGGAMLAATGQVYFRDLTNILPYFLRISLYLAPVLYYVDDIPERFRPFFALNPLFALLGSLSDVVTLGDAPSAGVLALGAAWAFGLFLAGAVLFMSKEREFAVRL
jgi:teichoic acid transport system permease protein